MNRKMKSCHFLIVLLILLISPSISSAEADNTIVLTDDTEEYSVSRYLDILEDPTGRLTFQQIRLPEYGSRFIRNKVETPNFGFTNSAYWVRFRARNESSIQKEWIVDLGYVNMHYIDFYACDTSGNECKEIKTGVMMPSASHQIPYYRFAFKLSFDGGTGKTVYMCLKSGGAMTIQLRIFTLPKYHSRMSSIYLFIGLLAGFLATVILINFFMFFSVKDKSYLYYAISIFLFSIIEAVLSGTGPYYVWSDYPRVNEYILPCALVLCIISFLRFTSIILETRERSPYLHKLFIVLQLLWLSVIIINLSSGYIAAIKVGNIFVGISIFISLVSSFFMYFKGVKSVRFYMVACSVFFVSVVLYLLLRFAITPTSLMLEHSYRIGAVSFIFLLGFALGDRFNMIRAESAAVRKDLKLSEGKLSAIFNQSYQLSGMLSLDGILLAANKTALNFIGADESDVLDRPFWETPWWNRSEEQQKIIREAIRKAAAGEIARFESVHFDSKGNKRHLDGAISPVKDESGNIKFLITESRDITELKKAEESLILYRDHLEELVKQRTRELEKAQAELIRSEKFVTIGRMASKVSHEMRNPLGTIRTTFYYIREMARGHVSGLDQGFERIDRNIARCDNIVDELSEYTRIRNLNFVLTDIDKWLEMETGARKIPAEIKVVKKMASGAKVYIDNESLHKCLQNILDNAVQAVNGEMCNAEQPPDIERDKCITVECRVSGKRLEMEICDTGGGIKSEYMDKIFEPLFSTKGFGVGLGLPIAKQIIEQHNGGIDIQTEPGKWTRVILWLPIVSL